MPFDNPHDSPFGDLELLRTARGHISDRDNWLKGVFRDGDRHCLVAALSVAAGSFDFRLPNRVERRLARVLAAQIPRTAPLLARFSLCTARYRLISFNDHPQTHHGNVLAVYDRAIDHLSRQTMVRVVV